MLNLTFYTIEEKFPEHNQEVMLLLKQGLSNEYELFETVVEYSWEEFDSITNFPTGEYFCLLDYGSKEIPKNCSYRLILVDQTTGNVLTKDNCFYCPLEEYLKSFP